MRAFIIVIAISALLGGVFFYALNRDPVTIDTIPSPLQDEVAPAISLETFTRFQAEYGATLQPLEQPLPIVLNFWASWCPPCHQEAPFFEAAWRKYQDKVLFVGANSQERSLSKAEEFIQEYGYTFPNGRDNVKLWAEYGVYAMPETFFISSEGIIVDYHRGPMTASMLDEEIAELLAHEQTNE